MNKWTLNRLGDIAIFKNGKSRPTDTGDIPVYGGNGILDYTDKSNTEGEVVIVGRVGAYCGSVFYENKPIWVSDNAMYVLPKNNYNSKYLYYLLKKSQLNRYAQGSSHPLLTQTILNNIEVMSNNDITEQQEIAFTLSSLDDKIELNLQMNQTLETMAQTIFKEWFVNFNFPGFDGELVNSLPKGWRMGQVQETCKVNASTLSIRDEIDPIKYIEISEVQRGMIKEISIYRRGEEPSRAKRKLLHGDTVLSTVRPNRGSYFLAIHPDNNMLASTGFAVFTPTTVPFSFLYCFLTDKEQIEYYGRMADGAAYPAINPNVIMKMSLVIPSKNVLELFKTVSENLYLSIYENFEENKSLAQIRDSLLPKLMTGKIEIKR